MYTLPSGRVRFGAFELDLSTGELRSIDAPDPKNKVILREQVFQVLRMLVEREGQIVTRDEIKGRLWPDNTVVDFDHSINVTIKTLRRALGDSADSPGYIETLARRGYRLMPSIEYLESAPKTALEKDRGQRERSAVEMKENVAGGQRQPKFRWWKVAIVAAFVVILTVVTYMSWPHLRPITPPKSEKIRLAVLPFQNLTGDSNKEYLADGLTEEMISQLGRLNPQQLGVIARTSVMGYKHKDERLDQIGRDLSVQYVLENSLRASGDHLRLTAQLIQVKDQTHVWSQDYDYSAKDTINVEDDVAKAVVREINLRLTSQQQADLTRAHPVNPEAFDAYLQGNYYLEYRDLNVAAKYFERATQLDPSYALAWARLCHARLRQVDSGLIPTEEGHRLASKAVERALALDPNLAEAHAQMGEMRLVVFDWAGADASYQRALAIEPGNAVIAEEAGNLAAILGRFDEGLRLARRSVELDPLDAFSRVGLGQLEYWMGALDEAQSDIKRGLELNPRAPSHTFLAEIYVIQGRPQDALGEIDQERTGPFRLEHYAIAYRALGREKESDAALQELIAKYQTAAPYLIAQVYAFWKQPDEAFKWLDRAYSQHDDSLVETKVSPLLKNLHNDPRYVALLKKLNLPTD